MRNTDGALAVVMLAPPILNGWLYAISVVY